MNNLMICLYVNLNIFSIIFIGKYLDRLYLFADSNHSACFACRAVPHLLPMDSLMAVCGLVEGGYRAIIYHVV